LAGESRYLETGNVVAGSPKVFVELLHAITPHLTPVLKQG
jgi:myo-inositol-1(or 4)-monophosphatase